MDKITKTYLVAKCVEHIDGDLILSHAIWSSLDPIYPLNYLMFHINISILLNMTIYSHCVPFPRANRIALDEPIVYNMVMRMYVCVQLHFYTQLFLIDQNMSF